jgi:hypothetical protein
MNHGQSTTAVLAVSGDTCRFHPISELCIHGPAFESGFKVSQRVKVWVLFHFVVYLFIYYVSLKALIPWGYVARTDEITKGTRP